MKSQSIPLGRIALLIVSLAWLGSLPTRATTIWQGPAGGDWFADGNWSEGVPGAGTHAVIEGGASVMLTNETAELASFTMSGGTMTFSNWTTRLRATEVVLTNAATLALPPAFSDTQMSNRVWIVCSNFTLFADAKIDAADSGYSSANGPGKGLNYSGGGHGGRGAIYRNWSDRGWTYGEVSAPSTPGSGGANPSRSRSGGGAVRIEASGEATVHGTISVDGGDYSTIHGAGGSGGSIFITCRIFSGSAMGVLSACGGNASSQGGAGGGGRIAIVYDGDAQAELIPVNPGVRFSAAPGTGGTREFLAEPGTLFLSDTQFLSSVLADQWDWVELTVPGWREWQVASLTVTGRIGFPNLNRMEVTNNVTIGNGGRLSIYGAVTNTAALEDGMHVAVGGSLTIAEGGRLVLTSNPSNGAPPYVTCNSLTVETDGTIDADYRGFASTGAGDGAYNGPGGGSTGAGYGGYGSMGLTSWTFRGAPYGDPEAPLFPGSGGGVADISGYGGGAVIIKANEAAMICGTISADGLGATRDAGSGGSGGAIYLRCKLFQGNSTGLLRARGGPARRTSDGYGGGGRIAVVYDPMEQAGLPQPNPGVRFSVAGAADDNSSMHRLAETGTLYMPDMESLFLSNQMTAQWDDVDLHIPGFTAWNVPALEISGCFGIRGLETLQVNGDFTLAAGGRFTLYSGPTNGAQPSVGAQINITGKLTVEAGATLMLCATNGVGPYVECSSLWVHTNGHIRADERGSYPGQGEGAGTGGGGGGYGGAGATSVGGPPYGKAFAPVAPGSGGGISASDIRGGRGGGLVRISARDKMRVDGLILADGMQNPRANGGAGSGGSVLLSARSFSGTGSLQAKGGNLSTGSGGGGGGGRIAVWTPFFPLASMQQLATNALPAAAKTFDPAVEYPELTVSVDAGSGGTNPAAKNGTIFFGRIVAGTLFMIR